MTTTVTALLVSHDGARWLPAVLDGLAGQRRPADRVVAVDTGSTDDSVARLTERLGATAVVTAPAASSYGEAVRAGLESLPPADPDTEEWVWLLHDDSNPAEPALHLLTEAARANPSVDILGPKLREWPSLRRLLEVGVTISGTGRRETGLERGEYDQGQHDQSHQVLAVNTAGMLVRRTVLEDLGFDPHLPIFGNDVDFGWRAARAGHRALVVPDAVVFHVEAAHRGVRRTPVTGSVRRGERRAALYTLLVNGSLWALPFQLVRLVLGTLVRALGFLLVRAPGEALDELVAMLAVYARPDRVVAGRARRRRTATLRPREVRHLLAAPWVPYRHGLDFVSDLALAIAHQAGDVSARRKAAAAEGAETGPVADEAENLPADTGLVARLLASRVAAVSVLLVVLSLVAARGLIGSGMLAGGGLLPAPSSAMHWWHLYLASGHDVGVGSSAPAAAYLLPMALLGTLLLGKAWLVVDLLFLFAVPLAAWGAHRFLKQVTGSEVASLWGAVAYGLLPVLTGAVQQGRLGTVAGSLVLPWLAHAALFLLPGAGPDAPDTDRRWRAAWRTALWLAVLVAFVPLAWPMAALVTLVTLALGLIRRRADWSAGSAWGPVVVPVLAVAVLLLPWSWATWGGQGAASVLFEAGLPAPELSGHLTSWGVALGRPGDGGAPVWLGVGIVLAAVAALLRGDTRAGVLRAWGIAVVAALLTVLLAAGSHALASSPVEQSLWLGFLVLVAQAALICAASMAATGIAGRLTGSSFGWRQPVGAAVVVLAALTPLAGLGWWVVSGSDGPLDRRQATGVPSYMTDAVAADPASGILEVRSLRAGGFEYVLLRGPGVRLGDDSVQPSVADQESLTELVSRLVTVPRPEDVLSLASYGVKFVYLPPPTDGTLVGNLDSVSGVTPGSAGRPGARAWQLDAEPTDSALSTDTSAARPWLLGLQGLALLVAAVLAAPTRRRRR